MRESVSEKEGEDIKLGNEVPRKKLSRMEVHIPHSRVLTTMDDKLSYKSSKKQNIKVVEKPVEEKGYVIKQTEPPLSKLQFKYQGDLFAQRGNYAGGMLYMSRLQTNAVRPRKLLVSRGSGSPSSTKRTVVAEPMESTPDSRRGGRNVVKRRVARKRQTARAIEAMTCNPLLYKTLVSDGIIPTLIMLSGVSDLLTVKFAISALCNMSCDDSGEAREVMIRSGLVPLLSNVISFFQNESLTRNCMAILANLTIEESFEGLIVKEKGVRIIKKYRDQSDETNYFCIMFLYNLTCPTYSYPRVDDVITALQEIAPKTEYPEIATRALYNICCVHANQIKFVELEGLPILCNLSKVSETTLSLGIRAFWQLAKNSGCRAGLQNIETIRIMVSSIRKVKSLQDLQCILVTITNIAINDKAAAILGTEETLDILTSLTQEFYMPAIRIEIFRIIALLVSHDHNAQFIKASLINALLDFDHGSLQEDSISSRLVLYSLARIAAGYTPEVTTGKDPAERLLCTEDVSTRLFLNLSTMSIEVDDSRDYIRFTVFYNCSFFVNGSELIDKIGDKLLEVGSKTETIGIMQLVGKTIVNACRDNNVHQSLLSKGLLDVVCHLLDSQESDVIIACLDIVSLLFDGKRLEQLSYVEIIEKIFPRVVRFCLRDNDEIRARSVSCLSWFSTVKECQRSMVRNGLISSLAILAGDDDPRTLQLCVCTYSHLSCDPEICDELINSGIVKSLTSLAAAPEETVRQACAIAFCNLSLRSENISSLVMRKSLPALLVISCVKSNHTETRRLCLKAILNLIREEASLSQLCEEGLTWALATFAATTDDADSLMIAQAFCRLTYCASSRKYFYKVATLNSFLNLLSKDCDDIKVLLLRGSLNLIHDKEAAGSFLQARILNHATRLINSENTDILVLVSQVVVIIYQIIDAAHAHFLENGALAIIAQLLRTNHPPCQYHCALLVHRMSLNAVTVSDIIGSEQLLRAIIDGVDKCSEKTMYLLMRSLYNISCGSISFRELCRIGVVNAISYILNFNKEDIATLKMCAAILRNLSTDPTCHGILVEEGGVTLLNQIFAVKDKACKEDCAMTICNIALGNINSTQVLEQGALPAILWLTNHQSDDYKSVCSAVLRKMATPPGNFKVLFEGDIVPNLAFLLEVSSNMYVKHNCIATLALLSENPRARALLSASGVISKVLDIVRVYDPEEEDPLFEQMCADLLSNLSEYVRAENIAEGMVTSSLLKLLEGDSHFDQDRYWKRERGYLLQGSSSPLPLPVVSSERKIRMEECPSLEVSLYPIEYDGFKAEFSQYNEVVPSKYASRLKPDPQLLGQCPSWGMGMPDSIIQADIQSQDQSGKAEWKDVANMNVGKRGEMFSKIRTPNKPLRVEETADVKQELFLSEHDSSRALASTTSSSNLDTCKGASTSGSSST